MSEDILTLPPPPADRRISYGPDSSQFADLRLPRAAGPFAAVLNIHGGFWRAKYDLHHAGHVCAALTACGLATINVEYRRGGNPGGGWPGTFSDIRNALRYFQQHASQHHLDPGRMIVMGHSAGGQLAVALAAHGPSVRGVVSLAGVLDLCRAHALHLSNDAVAEFLGGKPHEVPAHYRDADPMQLSIPKATTQWIIHGTADDVVPPGMSREYVEAKKKGGEDVRHLPMDGAGHFDLIDPRTAAWTVIASAVLRLAEAP